MRYDPNRQSRDVDDQRGRRSVQGPSGNLVFTLFRIGARFGWKGIAVAGLAVVGLFVAQNFASVGDGSDRASDNDAALGFVSSVLDDVQGTWDRLIPGYSHTKLVLFRDSFATGCGYGVAATGPFYCPIDQKVYLDLSFFDELAQRFGAPGDFAQAYVIAHEVGHHVQHLQGTDRGGVGARGATGGSVRLELQADCYAGVWAHAAQRQGILDGGDLEEGLRAAAAIGDDHLQRETTGTVRPDAFTHGTSDQRVRWLRVGYTAGVPAACDTFSANPL